MGYLELSAASKSFEKRNEMKLNEGLGKMKQLLIFKWKISKKEKACVRRQIIQLMITMTYGHLERFS